ncbi:MAG: SGNH/GDSL hydrolase family protein [Thermoactinospora sp.]|nr:SGNH/GDSL hydrolase family protein [Thermoactinospora sp.]
MTLNAAKRPLTHAVLSAVLGVALALTAFWTGAFDVVACKALAIGCPDTTTGTLPQVRRLTPKQVALSGSYIALGDSFSSGEGVYDPGAPPIDRGAGLCHRSSGSYVPQITRSHPFAGGASFWACAGATTTNLLRGQHGHSPQIDRVSAETSLVTVSIGGNDAGFTDVLKECIVRLPWSSRCVEQEPAVLKRIDGLGPSMREVLRAIRDRAPQARVVVVGYPRIFPREPGGRVDNLSPDDQRWLNRVGHRLNETIGAAVAEFDRAIAAFKGPGSAEFVDPYDAFDGHEIGRAQPYMNALDVDVERLLVYSRSYHPTADGYRKLGELVARQIDSGPERPLNNVTLP